MSHLASSTSCQIFFLEITGSVQVNDSEVVARVHCSIKPIGEVRELELCARRRFDDLERYYEKTVRQLQSQLAAAKEHLDRELASSSRQLEASQHQVEELSSRLSQRNNQCRQLQREYDALRVRTGAARLSPALSPARLPPNTWRATPQTSPAVQRRVSHVSQFVFKPITPQGTPNADTPHRPLICEELIPPDHISVTDVLTGMSPVRWRVTPPPQVLHPL